MAASTNETFPGALEVLLKQLAVMKALPDADLPLVINLETQVIEHLRSPERQMQKAGLMPPGGMNPAGNGALGLNPMGGGGASAPPPSFMGAGIPGGPPTAPPPANPDEMRRVLTAAGQ